MRFQCDRCGKRYSTDQPLRDGRTYTIKCRVCGHKVVVRASPAEAAAGAGAGRAPEPELPTTLPPPSEDGTTSTVSSAYVLPPDILGSLAAPAQGAGSADPFAAAASDPFAANSAPPPAILPPDLERTPTSRPALHDFVTAPIPPDPSVREPTPPALPSAAFGRRGTLPEPPRAALAVRAAPVWEEPEPPPTNRRKLFLAVGGGVAAAAAAAYFFLSDSGTPTPRSTRPPEPARAAAPASPPPAAARPENVPTPLPERAAPPPQIPVTSEERIAALPPEPPAARPERSTEPSPSRRNEHPKKAPPPRHVASTPRGRDRDRDRDPAPTTVTVKPVDFGGTAPPAASVAVVPPPAPPAPAPVAIPAPAPETRVALARPAPPPPAPEPVAAAPAPVPAPPRAVPTPAPSPAPAPRGPAAHEEARSDVMKVLLRKDVDGLGASGTTVEVPTAYGRSFIIAKGLGVAVPSKGARAPAKTADAAAPKEDDPVFPGAGYRRPVPASPNCIEKSLRIPDGRNAGSVTVKFAVGRTGLADLVHVQPGPDFSGGRLEPRLVDAVSSAVKGCRFTPGADEQGRPARLWVVMQVPLGG